MQKIKISRKDLNMPSIRFGLSLLTLLSFCGLKTNKAEAQLGFISDTVKINSGLVKGFIENGVKTFIGIPYAAPPVGELHFKAPQNPEPWAQVYDATSVRVSAPQIVPPLGKLELEPIVGKGWIKGDNYLTLNVWAPNGGKDLPVMVYIHGGAFTIGNKDASVYNGSNFAKSGVVCININYRLGINGFLAIPGALTNLGLRDMLFALKWVNENVAKFGGSPNNVTIFGESGGGTATACLVTSPLSKGLFSKAIIQSGPALYAQSTEVSLRVVNELAKQLKIKPDVQGFSSASQEDCLKAISKIAKPGKINLKNENGIDVFFGGGKFHPVYGDDVLPEHPITLLQKGAGKDIPLLLTTTSDEANIFLVPANLLWIPGFIMRRVLYDFLPKDDAKELWNQYEKAGLRGGEILSNLLTNEAFRRPVRVFAANHQGQTNFMEFDWRSEAFEGKMGAAHSIDLPLVFKTSYMVVGKNQLLKNVPDKALEKFVHDTWVNFANGGTLPWPEYSNNSQKVLYLKNKNIVDEILSPQFPIKLASVNK